MHVQKNFSHRNPKSPQKFRDSCTRSTADGACTDLPQRISAVGKSICTYGEFLRDGAAIELVRDPGDAERLLCLYWNGKRSITRSRVALEDGVYVPAILDPTVLRALQFPARSDLSRASSLMADISDILVQYSGLREPFIMIVGRFILATWLFGVITAPWLSIVGPETVEGTNLFKLLSCLCRHALPLTGLDLRTICSLPMKLGMTLMLRSPALGPNIQRTLAITRKRDGYTLQNGRLHDLHCSLVTYSPFSRAHTDQGICRLEIPIEPSTGQAPILRERTQEQIAGQFQPRLLAYRLNNFLRASDFKICAAQFTCATRELAESLGACTPSDALPEGIVRFLETYDAEIRSAKWIDPDVAIIESLASFCREGTSRFKYMGDIAKDVCVILSRRGDERVVKPKEVGGRVRLMGFEIKPRDSKGFRVERTATFCERVNLLAKQFAIPPVVI